MMNKRQFIGGLVACAAAGLWIGGAFAADFGVDAFGARTDAAPAANAAAIQKAIDAASAAGGGRVVVPAGVHRTGTVWLRSNVELHLEKGAVLLGSDNLDDYNAEDAYPQNGSSPDEGWSGKHLILAVCQTNVAVTGEGVVDGNGTAFLNPTGCKPNPTAVAFRKGYVNIPNRASKKRPGQELAFVECRGVRVEGVTLRNMAMWTCFFHGCDDVKVDRVMIRNDVRFANTDGFDIDACRNVRVTNCDITTSDDGLAIRGCPGRLTDTARACEDIFASNVVINSECEGVRIGIGTGVVRRVTLTHLDIRRAGRGLLVQGAYAGATHRGLTISDVTISDVRIRDTVIPIGVTAGGTSRSPIERIRFERIDAEYEGYLAVVGAAGCRPMDVLFKDCSFKVVKGPYVPKHDWELGVMKTGCSAAVCVDRADGVRFENTKVAFDPECTGVRSLPHATHDATVFWPD